MKIQHIHIYPFLNKKKVLYETLPKFMIITYTDPTFIRDILHKTFLIDKKIAYADFLFTHTPCLHNFLGNPVI